MNVPTTVATPIEITRRQLGGLIVAVATTAAALTWALTAVAVDTRPEQARATTATKQDVPAANPAATAVTTRLDASDSQPIIVADGYHGVGFTVCRGDAQPVSVADSYQGVGVTLCV